MPLGLNMGPSTASTASMFSFASSNSQLDNHSAYSGKNPYAQQAKTADVSVPLPSGSKPKGLGKAFSGLGKRFGSSSRKGASAQENDVLASAAARTTAAMSMAAATATSMRDIRDRLNPDPVSDRSYNLSERNSILGPVNPGHIDTHREQTATGFPSEGGLPAVHAVVVGARQKNDAASVGSFGPAKKKSKSNPTKVQHQYQDYGNVTDEDALQDAVERKNTGGVVTPFPEKLHEMLSANVETEIIDWAPHGRCFIIKKPKVFAATIMPKHFKHTKITSFQRQLNLYGFKRITKGKDRGAYYHELFLRGRPKLSTKMRRQRIKGVGHKPLPDPDNEPDFYAMEPLDMPAQAQVDEQLSDAASLSQLSGLQSIATSIHSGGLQSLAASLPSVHSDVANACVADVNSFPQSVLSVSGLSTASPVSIQQAQMLGIVAQQQQQISISGASLSGASQQSDELQRLSQLLEQQRQQIEQQQRQLQQRQQQLLQEELIMQQKEVLLLQQQQQQQQALRGLQMPAVVSSLQLALQQKQLIPKIQLTPSNMNVSVPLNCDATAAEMSAVSGADFSEVGTLDAPALTSGVIMNGIDIATEGVVSSSKMPPPAARVKKSAPDVAKSSEAVPVILQDLGPKKAPSSKEDPSVGLSSFDSGSKKSASRRGISTTNKSMSSLSKRLSMKSWGSVGSTSKASRTSSRRKMPWSRRSQASVSSNGSDGWLDEEQKMALEATIDFDSIFEGAAAH